LLRVGLAEIQDAFGYLIAPAFGLGLHGGSLVLLGGRSHIGYNLK
jgi:hypothetical protein